MDPVTIGYGVFTIASTLFSMSSNSKAAKAEARAMAMRAAAKRRQAAEILKRNEFNVKKLRTDAHEFSQVDVASFAKSGVDVGSGAALLALEDTQDRMLEEIDISTREAEFTAEQLRMGADVDIQAGSNARKAASSQNTARFLQGVASAASPYVKG